VNALGASVVPSAVTVTVKGDIVIAGTDIRGHVDVVRLTADGSVDAAFGTAGRGTSHAALGAPASMTIAPDGKILVAGNGTVERFGALGSPDPVFGDAGAITDLGVLGSAIDVTSNGSILIAGGSLTRLNPVGDRDTNFGSGGFAGPIEGGLNDVATLPDGSIVAVGGMGFANNIAAEPVLTTFDQHGVRDDAFGQALTAPFRGAPIGSSTSFDRVLVQPDGSLLIAGLHADDVSSEHRYLVLVRGRPDGTLDTSFGNGGFVVTLDFWSVDLAIDAAGRILVAGTSNCSDGFTCRPALARFFSSGVIDGTFGDGGVVELRDQLQTGFSRLALQPDGKVIAVGVGLHTLNHEAVLAVRFR
jgi:uncharacterized delta-60 repeat protein